MNEAYTINNWTPALKRVLKIAEVFANQDNLYVGIEHVLEAVKVQKERSSDEKTTMEIIEEASQV